MRFFHPVQQIFPFKVYVLAYTQGLEINPRDPGAFYARAGAKNKLEDYIGAIEDYTSAIEVNP